MKVALLIVLSVLYCSEGLQFGHDEYGLFGGSGASPGQFPYVTFIFHKNGNRYTGCSGALIHASWTVTAAHCITEHSEPRDYLVLAGGLSYKAYVYVRMTNIVPFYTDLPGLKEFQERRAGKVLRHPLYGNQGEHDVGLIRTIAPFKYNANVGSISLSTEVFTRKQNCTIAGYDLTENNVRHYRLEFIKGVEAKASRYCKVINFGNYICVSEIKEGTCPGNSGHPLVCGGSVVGIASHSLGKGGCSVEQYFTDVAKNEDWLSYVLYHSNHS